MLRQVAQKDVSEQAMHKVYDDAVKRWRLEAEVRARHILVENEDHAKAIVAELKKGADFAELAKKKSKDPAAAEGRRSWIFHQGSDGAGIRRRRIQTGEGQDLRPGKKFVRLAHHQGSRTSARSRCRL